MGYLSDLYAYVYKDIYHENDFNFVVNGTALLQGFVFFALSSLYMYVDLTGKPQWMLKYKTQPGVNQPVTKELVWKALKLVLFNQVFVSGPMLLLLFPVQVYRGCSFRPEDIPSLLVILRDMVIMTLLREVSFYYLHRLTHWGPLYRHIHKIHHEFPAPMGLTSVYAHPLEHIFVNLGPVMLLPIILGCHQATNVIWTGWAQIETIMTHSGYHLPFQMSPEFHDYHHLKFHCNYSGHGFMDWLHGTAGGYYNSVQRDRDQVLMGFTPLTQQYPDSSRKQD